MSRPVTNPAFYLTGTSTVGAGGTGYVVGDVLTLASGSFVISAQVTVSAVFNGAVTTFTVSRPGNYNAGGLPTNPVPTTGGTGTGCTIRANWLAANPGSTNIQHYGTNTAGTLPVAGSLQNRELFIDTATPTVYVGNQLNSPVKIVGSLGRQDSTALNVTGVTQLTGLPLVAINPTDATSKSYVDQRLQAPRILAPAQVASNVPYNLALIQPLPILDGTYPVQNGDRVLLYGQGLSIISVTINTGGQNYSVGDALTAVGGTFTSPAVLRVTAVTAGLVTAVDIIDQGSYSAYPAFPASFSTSGSGAFFTATFTTAPFGALNGVYVASSTALWQRSIDASTGQGATTGVTGTQIVGLNGQNRNISYQQTSLVVNINVDPQTWVPASGITVPVNAATGLSYQAGVLNFVNPGTPQPPGEQAAYLQAIDQGNGTTQWTTMRGTTIPTLSTDVCTKGYADALVSGVNAKPAVMAATIEDLTGGWTYDNAAGTITSNTLGAASIPIIDGYTPALNDRLLIKNEGAQAATSATVTAPGTGYTAGLVLTLQGGTLGTGGRAATFTVATISGSGVATVTVLDPGLYQTLPANPAATTSSGAGTGCVLNVVYSNTQFINGIYQVSQLGQDVNPPTVPVALPTVLTRTADANTYAELVNAVVAVTGGTTQAGLSFATSIPATGTLGTTNIIWVPFGFAGTALPVARGGTGVNTVGTGLIPFGNSQLPLGTDTSLSWDVINRRLGLGTQTPAALLHVEGWGRLQQAIEKVELNSMALTGTVPYSFNNQAFTYYTANAAANWIWNFTGLTGMTPVTLNSLVPIGHSVTVALMTTQGATAYYATAIQIDGVTPAYIRWQGAAAPTAGNASGNDVYVFTIIKTADATFSVIGSLTRYGGQ